MDKTSNVQLVPKRSYYVPKPETTTTPKINKPVEAKKEPILDLPVIAPLPKAKVVPPPVTKPVIVTSTPQPEKTPEPVAKSELKLPEKEIPPKKVSEPKPLPKQVTVEKAVTKPEPVVTSVPTELEVEESIVTSLPAKKPEAEKRVGEKDLEKNTWTEEQMEDYIYEDEEQNSREVELRGIPESKFSLPRLSNLTTNTLTLGILSILLLMTVSGLGINYLLKANSDKEIVVDNSLPSPLILPNIKTEFIVLPIVSGEGIKDEVEKITSETTALVFVKAGTAKEPVANTGLLNLLTESSNAGILSSLKQIYFGKNDLGTPFVLLLIGDEVTARGGMLAWEETLYQDFSTTFDLAQTENEPRFIDRVIDEVDARVLLDENNNELLTYGLINNMIIITTDSLTFGELVKLIK